MICITSWNIIILVSIRIHIRNPTLITVLIIHEVVMSQRDTTQPWQCLNSRCDATRLVFYLLANVYSKLEMSPIRDDSVTKLLSAWYNWIGVQKRHATLKIQNCGHYYARFTLSRDLLNISKHLFSMTQHKVKNYCHNRIISSHSSVLSKLLNALRSVG